MMRFRCMYDGFRFSIFSENFAGDESVGAFHLKIDRFAEVMQESGAFRHLNVRPDFRREHRADVRNFHGVVENILPVRTSVFHFTQKMNDFGRKSGDSRFEDGALSGFDDANLDLRLRFFDDLFDSAGMNASVNDQICQGDPSDFSPNGIEP